MADWDPHTCVFSNGTHGYCDFVGTDAIEAIPQGIFYLFILVNFSHLLYFCSSPGAVFSVLHVGHCFPELGEYSAPCCTGDNMCVQCCSFKCLWGEGIGIGGCWWLSRLALKSVKHWTEGTTPPVCHLEFFSLHPPATNLGQLRRWPTAATKLTIWIWFNLIVCVSECVGYWGP